MHGTGDQLLACPRLAENQNRDVSNRRLLSSAHSQSNGLALADDRLESFNLLRTLRREMLEALIWSLQKFWHVINDQIKGDCRFPSATIIRLVKSRRVSALSQQDPDRRHCRRTRT